MKPLRGKRTYRSLMVLPYAIPAFISILVWAGLLNDQFGAINSLLKDFAHIFDSFLSWFGIHQTHTFAIPWLQNPWWARVSVLLVNLWLGFPYFFLVCTGALTSIPADLTEAAAVDGATPRQSFRKITLPLLLVAVGPLLVASFSYNFNNFTMIYLLTGGGPIVNPKSVAGATDILISYTYKLSFTAGKGQQYGLASAVSILIFFMIAGFSVLAFRRTRVLEDTNR
jgi:arabinogalactan oligomer/maltooligosaccharide transport system permease protein